MLLMEVKRVTAIVIRFVLSETYGSPIRVTHKTF
jgi:hypothetical protein